jgi:hypothetical protein
MPHKKIIARVKKALGKKEGQPERHRKALQAMDPGAKKKSASVPTAKPSRPRTPPARRLTGYKGGGRGSKLNKLLGLEAVEKATPGQTREDIRLSKTAATKRKLARKRARPGDRGE